jgi:hypothetical protein
VKARVLGQVGEDPQLGLLTSARKKQAAAVTATPMIAASTSSAR